MNEMDRSTGPTLPPTELAEFFRTNLDAAASRKQTKIMNKLMEERAEELEAERTADRSVTPEDIAQMDAGIDVVGQRKSWHFDEGKPAFELIPPLGMLELARVATFGKKKYGAQNYAEEADNWSWLEPCGSILRHTWYFLRGQYNDDESGLPHLAHAAFNALMLIDIVQSGKGTDNRSPLVLHKEEEL